MNHQLGYGFGMDRITRRNSYSGDVEFDLFGFGTFTFV